MTLPNDPFLQTLIARFMQPGVIGMALVGSYSRGLQDKYSDVDLDLFTDVPGRKPLALHLVDGKLVSLKSIFAADEFSSLTKPEKAVWAVPGLRRMQILFDETGEIAKLQQAAWDFNWSVLQPAANAYAARKLMGCAEEAQKIMGGLANQNESKVLYAAWGLFAQLTEAIIVQQGWMIESENRYLSIPQEHLGDAHPWVRAFRLAFGMDAEATVPAWRMRGLASLDLYEQTAILFKKIIPDDHREVIMNTLQLIAEFKQEDHP